MKKTLIAVATLALPLLAGPVYADLLELRVGAGINSASDDAFEKEVNDIGNNGISTDDFENFNADIFFNIPAFPIGVGLRQEWLNLDESSNGDSLEVEVSNTSLLVDLRLIDTVFYVGPIVAIGIPTADIDFSDGGSHIKDSVDGSNPSYAAGVEAGVHLGSFIVGAEVGYQSIELESSDTAGGVSGKFDLSGTYGKVMLGLSFL